MSGCRARSSERASSPCIILVGCGVASYFVSSKLPTSFVPDEDQGYFYLNIQLPNAASLQRTELVTAKVEDILAKTPGVRYSTGILGFSLLSLVRTSYNAFIFVTMNDWDDRKTRAEQFQAIKARLNRELSALPEGVAFSFLSAGDSRSRDLGRIHFRPGRPGRQGRPVFVRQPEQVYGRGAQAPGDRNPYHHFPAERAAAIRATWIATK